jgi:hypothetical protein
MVQWLRRFNKREKKMVVSKVLVRVYGEGVKVFFNRDDEVRTFECVSRTVLQWTNRIRGFLEQGSKATGSKIFTQSIDGVRKPLMELYPKDLCESAMRVWSLLEVVLKSKHTVSFKSWWDEDIFGRINTLNGHVRCTWPTFRPNGRIVFFATRWQIRGVHI